MDGFSILPLLFMCVVVLMVVVGISFAMRIVPEYKRAVIFRLGRYVGVYGPGLMFIVPVIDREILVDLREQTCSLTAQHAITADNVPLMVDLTWRYRVVDPEKRVLEVADPDNALRQVAGQTWQALVESQPFHAIINDRPQLGAAIRQQLEETTARWGIEVTAVQLSEIKKGR
ncbi:MAG: SPFH domain-containing protein [Chloroflexota bacterium]